MVVDAAAATAGRVAAQGAVGYREVSAIVINGAATVAVRDVAIHNSQSVDGDGRARANVKHAVIGVAVHGQIVRAGSADDHAITDNQLAGGERDGGRVSRG